MAIKKDDPGNCSGAAMARLLNSTNLGTVVTTQTLRKHKERAGFRVGPGNNFNLLKYWSWLLGQRHAPKAAAKSYEEKKAEVALAGKLASQVARDIGEIPAVKNQPRRDECALSFKLFCETYFPRMFSLKWSADHQKVIKKIEQSILGGGLFAFAMPRGSGKTSLCECAAIWSVLYGYRPFVALIGPSEPHACQLLDAIKMHLETNRLLSDDFPEVIFPIRELEGISKRCKGQTSKGQRTHIEWSDDVIIMPTVTGSKAGGAIIKVAGLTGSGVRGMKTQTADGETLRPSLVIVDDPQTDESARSRDQCVTRERILSGAILGMAGPGKKIAGFMPCTVIRPGDVADKMLNSTSHPDWNGERTKLIYKFPENAKLWETYAELRADGYRQNRGLEDATAFYLMNRVAMDLGAEVAWPERFNTDEISAIQHAMNLKLRSPEVFFAEYQNEPVMQTNSVDSILNREEIAGKLNNFERLKLPLSTSRVTMFIDIQQRLLFYTICAWSDDFTGYVIDYGSWPNQRRQYFTLADAQETLDTEFPAAGMEGRIYSGLEKLADEKLSTDFIREDGIKMRISQCLIDANWGPSTNLVYQFCRQHSGASILMPAHGRFVGASSKPFNEYARKPGERIGLNWRIPLSAGDKKRETQHVLFDGNYWKSFIFSRLGTTLGDRGALSLFGNNETIHECFADHLTAEYRVRTSGRGRTVDEWKIRPERRDNHWLDCVVGCAVAAAMQGSVLAEVGAGGGVLKKKKIAVDMATLGRRRMEMA